jgi:hypothetical protein
LGTKNRCQRSRGVRESTLERQAIGAKAQPTIPGVSDDAVGSKDLRKCGRRGVLDREERAVRIIGTMSLDAMRREIAL